MLILWVALTYYNDGLDRQCVPKFGSGKCGSRMSLGANGQLLSIGGKYLIGPFRVTIYHR